MPKPKTSETWYSDAIKLMIEERLDFATAASFCGENLSPEEAANHQRRDIFKAIHAKISREYYENKSTPAQHSKSRLIGEMRDITQRLLLQGKFKEAADVIGQTAKIDGMVGPDVQNNIFANLTGDDLVKMREALSEKKPTIQ